MLVGLCGKIGSGKTTLAQMLQPCTVISFAAPLKNALEAMGVPRQYLYNPDLKERPLDILCGKTPRYAMQTLGTEWGRNMIGPGFWRDLWRNKVGVTPGLVVCDDVRFVGEVELIRELGGLVVAITRPGVTQFAHESEQLNFEANGIPVIVNDGTPGALLEKFNAHTTRGT